MKERVQMSAEANVTADLAASSGPGAAGTLAHDINNLLGVVVTNLDLLCEQIADLPLAAGLAAEIVDAALRASELSRTLIGVAAGASAAAPIIAPAAPGSS